MTDEEVVLYRFRCRRDTAQNFWDTNDLLLDGEFGIETDTGRFKLGDGNTPWRFLRYAGAGRIDLTDIATGSILAWNAVLERWVPINLASLADGAVLTWDATNTRWAVELPQVRDTAANFTANNPVLRSGRLGFETNTGRFKIGDGTTAYNSLPYVGWGTIDLTALAEGARPTWRTAGGAKWVAEVPHDEGDDYETIYAVFDGGGTADVPVGKQCEVVCDFPFDIISYTLISPDTGSIVIDTWAATYAAYPPTVANSIAASAKPNLVSAKKNRDIVLTGWTKTFAADTVIRFNVDSCTDVKRATLQIKIKRTN